MTCRSNEVLDYFGPAELFCSCRARQLMKDAYVQFTVGTKVVQRSAELTSRVSLSMPQAGKRQQTPNCCTASFSKVTEQDHISAPCIIRSSLLLPNREQFVWAVSYTNSMLGLALPALLYFPPLLLSVSVVPMKYFSILGGRWNIILSNASSLQPLVKRRRRVQIYRVLYLLFYVDFCVCLEQSRGQGLTIALGSRQYHGVVDEYLEKGSSIAHYHCYNLYAETIRKKSLVSTRDFLTLD